MINFIARLQKIHYYQKLIKDLRKKISPVCSKFCNLNRNQHLDYPCRKKFQKSSTCRISKFGTELQF